MTATKTRLAKLERLALERRQGKRHFGRYEDDPVGYVRDVLQIRWWSKQIEIAQSLRKPPYKALVLSAHSVGKTHTGAALTSWWYDTWPDGVVITTAPTARDVKDLLWTEIRLQRHAAGRGGFIGAGAPEMRSSPGHFAKGFTAKKGESFQGRHHLRMLFIFDEAIGIPPIFWQTTKTMFSPTGRHAWVCLMNPTDASQQAYNEYLRAGDDYPRKGWHVITMSALDHPNIAAELAGQEPPYPSAVRLSQVDEWVSDWCTPVRAEDATGTDVQWPPGSGHWNRPGPLFECRALGMWPSQGTYSVWSDIAWHLALQVLSDEDWNGFPELGCDVARHGDDFTAIHVRRGPVSIHHESANGWTTAQTAGRLKQLVRELADRYRVDPLHIPVKVDPDGLGWGVIDQRGDFLFIPVSASAAAVNQRDYPNRRSELWFNGPRLAKTGKMSLARLDKNTQAKLRQQAMQPTWEVNAEGQCQVEPKEKTKERLGRSPDDMDAVNLAYWPVPRPEVIAIETTKREMQPAGHKPTAAKRRGLYGTS